MTRKQKLVLLAACLLASVAGGITYAAFSSQTSNSGNSFSAASSFGGTLRMATGSYLGDATDNRAIAGLGFEPDVVIIKAASNQVGVMRTSTMTGDLAKPLVGATALTANLIQSLTADGFTLGNDNRVNDSGITYYWTAFEAAADVLKVGSYTGNGTSQSLSGVGFAPEYVAVMAASNKDAVNRFSGMSNTFDFGDDKGIAARITSLDALGFSVGSNDRANAAGTIYHYVAFNDVGGSIKAGTYTGNATDNRSITGVGFQPGYVMVRADDAATNRKQNHKPLAQIDPNGSFFRGDAAYATGVKALEADGFKLGIDGSVNATGVTYHYLAFKDTAPGCSMPGTQTIVAAEDSWVEENSPTGTNGNDSTLKVTSKAPNLNARALFQFTLPAIPSDCTLTGATLRVYNKSPVGARTLNVYRNSAAWTEAAVTWNNQPGIAGTAVSAAVPGAAAYMQWTVTAHVQAMISGSNYGFQVRDSVESNASGWEQQFDSTEAGGTDHPQLLFTTG